MKFWHLLLLLSLAACGKTSTQALLDADLIVSGRSTIKLSTPANGATVLSESNLVFSWGDIPGAGNYLIEIADATDFSNIIISKQVTTNEYPFQRSDLKSGATFGSSTYYWRVSIISGAKSLLRSDAWVANFIADNAFYVDCAYTGTSYGTRLAPFKTIQTGLDSALGARLGVTTATAEVRVAKGICTESIFLRPNVLLKGGYDPSQNWVRNPSLYQTILSTTNAVAVQGFADLTSAFTATLMEGFKIQTTNTGSNIASSISLINANVTFRNNYLVATSAAANSGLGLCAVSIQGGNLTFDSNVLSATTASTNNLHVLRTFYFDAATVTATNNIFYVAMTATGTSAGGSPFMADVTGATGSSFTARNNTFFISHAGSNVAGNQNTLAGTPMNRSGTGTLTGSFDRNVIFLLTVSNSQRCGYQTGTWYLTSFKNNAMVDCNHSTNSMWYTNGVNQQTGYPGVAGAWYNTANAGSTGAPIDTVGGQGLANNTAAQNPVNCAGTCAAMSGNRGGNTVAGPTLPGTPSVVFQGYVAGDPTTFAFKSNTIADMDNNGAYDASIDAGANAATAGLVALP